MRDDLREVIAHLRTAPNPLAVQLLHYDIPMRQIVCAWQQVHIRTRTGLDLPAPPLSSPAWHLIEWAWAAAVLDRTETIDAIRAVVGPAIVVAPKMDQAIAAGIVFPDGTICQTADNYLRLKIGQIIKSAQGG